MDKALSAYELYFLNDCNCNLFLYEELKDIDNIDELFTSKTGRTVPCILLYPISKNMGHWTCIIPIKSNRLEFFDPYGMHIDQQLKLCYKKMPSYLSNLIKSSPMKVKCNTFQFQKLSKNVNTCGRWVLMRCWLWNDFKITLEEFTDLFKKNKNRDNIVTYITQKSDKSNF